MKSISISRIIALSSKSLPYIAASILPVKGLIAVKRHSAQSQLHILAFPCTQKPRINHLHHLEPTHRTHHLSSPISHLPYLPPFQNLENHTRKSTYQISPISPISPISSISPTSLATGTHQSPKPRVTNSTSACLT